MCGFGVAAVLTTAEAHAADERDEVDVDGTSLGPLVGFKFIAGPGFTGFAQLGVSYFAVHAEANDTTGAHEEADAADFLVNLNLNLGWSF